LFDLTLGFGGGALKLENLGTATGFDTGSFDIQYVERSALPSYCHSEHCHLHLLPFTESFTACLLGRSLDRQSVLRRFRKYSTLPLRLKL